MTESIVWGLCIKLISDQIVSLCVWHKPVCKYDVYNTIASVYIGVEFTCFHDNM